MMAQINSIVIVITFVIGILSLLFLLIGVFFDLWDLQHYVSETLIKIGLTGLLILVFIAFFMIFVNLLF